MWPTCNESKIIQNKNLDVNIWLFYPPVNFELGPRWFQGWCKPRERHKSSVLWRIVELSSRFKTFILWAPIRSLQRVLSSSLSSWEYSRTESQTSWEGRSRGQKHSPSGNSHMLSCQHCCPRILLRIFTCFLRIFTCFLRMFTCCPRIFTCCLSFGTELYCLSNLFPTRGRLRDKKKRGRVDF